MGTAIKKSGIPREEIFVVTKVSVRWLRLHIGGGMGGRGAVPPPPPRFLYCAPPYFHTKLMARPPPPPHLHCEFTSSAYVTYSCVNILSCQFCCIACTAIWLNELYLQ